MAHLGGDWTYVNVAAELERRASAKRERRMERLTWAIAGMTLANVVLVAYSIAHSLGVMGP
jgi:hypothetical protein